MKSRIAVALAAVFLTVSLSIAAPQDRNADKARQAAVKKEQKKDKKKDEKKDESKDNDKGKEEKKPGMNAETFSGLKFRSIGFLRAEVPVDWAGCGFGTGDGDCGES